MFFLSERFHKQANRHKQAGGRSDAPISGAGVWSVGGGLASLAETLKLRGGKEQQQPRGGRDQTGQQAAAAGCRNRRARWVFLL